MTRVWDLDKGLTLEREFFPDQSQSTPCDVMSAMALTNPLSLWECVFVFWERSSRYKYLSGATSCGLLSSAFHLVAPVKPVHTYSDAGKCSLPEEILSLWLALDLEHTPTHTHKDTLSLSNALSTSFPLCRPWALERPQPVKYTDTHTCMPWPRWPFKLAERDLISNMGLSYSTPLLLPSLPPSFLQSVLMWLGWCACFPHAAFFVFQPPVHFSLSLCTQACSADFCY